MFLFCDEGSRVIFYVLSLSYMDARHGGSFVVVILLFSSKSLRNMGILVLLEIRE
jgi:hypothetical protein